MKGIYYLLAAFIIFIQTACSTEERSRPQTAAISDTVKAIKSDSSILWLDPRINSADSLSINFYKDPFGRDSLRYTRYYTIYNTVDTSFISLVKNNLSNMVRGQEWVRPCRSEGKIFLYKNGSVFQTVYFSNAGGHCSFLYIIRDGHFYYSEIDPAFYKSLMQLKSKSYED